MHYLTATSFATPPVASFQDFDRVLLKAIRFWVIFARSGRDPRSNLSGLLGDRMAATFSLLMETVAVAWPEPFTTFPPCACLSSPDEATLMALLGHAEANRRDAADSLLGEMLPESHRARLWNAAVRCASEQLGGP